jgi:metallo-beta-lactamase family protein
MIVSASGMCEAGRILHHLANNIEKPSTLVLIIGFMAENTLGRRMIELRNTPGAKVKIFGDEYYLRARVKIFNSFSAHADANELSDYFDLFDRTILRKIFLVHGEKEAQDALAESLNKKGFKNIYIPARGDSVELP